MLIDTHTLIAPVAALVLLCAPAPSASPPTPATPAPAPISAADTADRFSPDEAAKIVAQYNTERPRCTKRDADRLRRDIESLEEELRAAKADKSVRVDRRHARSAAILEKIRAKRAELRDIVRGKTEPLPKNLLYSGSWEARTTDGRRLDGEEPLELDRGDFGVIDDDLGGSLRRYQPSRSPDAPFTLHYAHTVYTVKLNREQINDPHAFNTPVHAPEHRYSHSSSKETQRTEYRILIRGITTANTQVNPPAYTVSPEFQGDALFTHPFIVVEYRDALPPDAPTIILEPFDLEAFRSRARQSN